MLPSAAPVEPDEIPGARSFLTYKNGDFFYSWVYGLIGILVVPREWFLYTSFVWALIKVRHREESDLPEILYRAGG